MFILCTKKEKIRLKPDTLGKEYKKNILKAIYDTYLFKAVSENEVIVAIKEVTLFDGYVEQVTGHVQFEIEMTYLLQQIVKEEVCEGTISSQNPKGIFGDLIWTAECVYWETSASTKFNAGETLRSSQYIVMNRMKETNQWVWQNDLEDLSSVLIYETNSIVKFKICAINFQAKLDEIHPEEQTQIVGTMDGDGLGPASWWEIS